MDAILGYNVKYIVYIRPVSFSDRFKVMVTTIWDYFSEYDYHLSFFNKHF